MEPGAHLTHGRAGTCPDPRVLASRAPEWQGSVDGIVGAREGDSRFRAFVVGGVRFEGDSDPRPLRALGHAVLPGPARAPGFARRHGLRPAGRAATSTVARPAPSGPLRRPLGRTAARPMTQPSTRSWGHE